MSKRRKVLIHKGNTEPGFGQAPLKAEGVGVAFDPPGWVGIHEYLPVYGKEVLVTCGVEVGHCSRSHTDEHGDHWMIVGSSDEFSDVVAWQCVPPMPKWAIDMAKKRRRKKR